MKANDNVLSKDKVDLKISGADAIAEVLKTVQIDSAFVYPGTSELALCESVLKSDGIKLFNSRGDKECVFLAAGRSIFNDARSVAILHGARGTTNAVGAIADANRNEIAFLCIVGLPSSLSAKYLPPHGETNLIKNISHFAKCAFEISSDKPADQNEFFSIVSKAIVQLFSVPYGPVLLGIPQNYLESAWIDQETLNEYILSIQHQVNKKEFSPESDTVSNAVAKIEVKSNIVILIDDFLLRRVSSSTLAIFSELINASVLQLEYRRGPVFFQQMDTSLSNNLLGYYRPGNEEHIQLLKSADLLITIEDRNMYPRNIGKLPSVDKIVITSNKNMTIKNEYVGDNDLLIPGDVNDILNAIISKVSSRKNKGNNMMAKKIAANGKPEQSNNMGFLRNQLPEVMAACMSKFDRIAWVDDSQIFGGILKENYGVFPQRMKVFGDHGGFVGSGLGYACGLASASDFDLIVCTTGDHGFCNGFQSLYFSPAIKSKLLVLVCNNGKSVSLLTQSTHNKYNKIVESDLLVNLSSLNYLNMAQSVGLTAFSFDISDDQNVDKATVMQIMQAAFDTPGPTFVEMKCSSELETYNNLWACKGLDEK